MKAIQIYFDNRISNKKLPSVKFYLTSENNSYGILMNNWMDGDTMDMEINSDKYELSYSLKPEKYVHINTSKSVCSDVSFYQCFADKVSADNFENCPIKCSPLSLPFKNTSIIPACEKDEEAICAAKNVIYPIFLRIIDNELCPKSCTILQYSGKLMLKHVRQEINGNAYITIWYKFKLPEYVLVSEEYLIYDTTSMIGAVGGTLGMCIGFSFDSIIYHLINFLPMLLSIIQIKLTGIRKEPVTPLSTDIDEIIVEKTYTVPP